MTRMTKIIVGLLGTALMCTFILGLSHSISIGFAGFWGGFPFLIIALTVLGMAIYDFWDECIRKPGGEELVEAKPEGHTPL